MIPVQEISWAEANQNYLVMEFGRLRLLLGSEDGTNGEQGDSGQGLPQWTRLEPPAAIDRLSEIFRLSAFEREVLLLCAAVEMDSGLAARCAQLTGRENRSAITFSLALAAFPDAHWSALAPGSPLRVYHLVELEAGCGLTGAPLRIDERVLHYLAGVNHVDARTEQQVRLKCLPETMAEEHQECARELMRTLDGSGERWPLLAFCGDDAPGQEDIAAVVAHEAGRRLYVLAAEAVPAAQADADLTMKLWEREALLLPAALLVQCGAGGLTASARQLMERIAGPVMLASRDSQRVLRPSLRYTVNKPGPAAQKQLWQRALGTGAANLNGQMGELLDELSEQFRLSAETISRLGAASVSTGGAVDPARLWRACRSLSGPRLEELAERIVPSAGWDDLVLPAAQKQTLEQMAAQARHRMTVYEHWGFSAAGRRGLGIGALFAGGSGTGKTLAAEVLAKALRLDLYRIDLSAVVSKYIGETEKNLKQVFDAAEEGGVLLLFDEADALFGKRSEVKDSHDRYANIEVSYLLQRMESFQGLAVLTTNLKSALDKAFQRRVRFIVDFPFPGAAERQAIWERVFPAKTPTAGLDARLLAQLNMAGGSIRNIALNAAFLAAESASAVEMRHVLAATRQEALKMERPLAESETRGWV